MILFDLDATKGRQRDGGNGVLERATARGGERPAEREVPAETLAKVTVTAAIAAKDALDAELFNAVRVGLMLSSGRPGVKKVTLVLTDRTNPNRKDECALVTRPDREALVVSTDSRGKMDELARFTVNDPAAAQALRDAVHRFVLKTAEQFSVGGEG